jgi:hypothetical protein
MKKLGVLFLVLSGLAFAEAPQFVSGLIYRQTESVSIASAPAYTVSCFSLHQDGTYSQLYDISWRFRDSPSQYSYSEPIDGTFSYTKTGENIATLRLNPKGGTSGQVRSLSFTSGTGGTITDGIPIRVAFEFSDPSAEKPLLNLSSRIFLPAGKTAIVGFVAGRSLSGLAPTFLVRVIGPGLAAFGITDFLRDPRVTIIPDGAQSNDNWSEGNSVASIERVQTLVGAFPLPAGSKDSVLLVSAIGARTIVVGSSSPSDSGEVLVEVYLIP